MTLTIPTSNGPLTLSPATLAGAPIELIGSPEPLDYPEYPYTHALAYYSAERGVTGSLMLTAEAAAKVTP